MQATNPSSDALTVKTAASLLAKKALARREKRAFSWNDFKASPYFAPAAGAAAGAGIGGLGGYLSGKARQSFADEDEQDSINPWRGALTGALTGGLAGAGIGGAMSAHAELAKPTVDEGHKKKQMEDLIRAHPEFFTGLKDKGQWDWSRIASTGADLAMNVPHSPMAALGGLLGAATYPGRKIVHNLTQFRPNSVSSKSTEYLSHIIGKLGDQYGQISREFAGDPVAARAITEALRAPNKPMNMSYLNKLWKTKPGLAARVSRVALQPAAQRRWLGEQTQNVLNQFVSGSGGKGGNSAAEKLMREGMPELGYRAEDVQKHLLDAMQNGQNASVFSELAKKEKLYNDGLTNLPPVGGDNATIKRLQSELARVREYRNGILREAIAHGATSGLTAQDIDRGQRIARSGKNLEETRSLFEQGYRGRYNNRPESRMRNVARSGLWSTLLGLGLGGASDWLNSDGNDAAGSGIDQGLVNDTRALLSRGGQ